MIAAWGAALAIGGGSLFLWACQPSALATAKVHLKQGQVAEAQQQLEQALLSEPNNQDLLFTLGRANGLSGAYVKMAQAFDRVQELGHQFDGRIASLRRQYWSRIYNDGLRAAAGEGADLETARNHFDVATKVLPQDLRAWRNRAALDYQLGRIDDAITAFEYVAQHEPADTSTAYDLGVLYLEVGRVDEAALQFETTLAQGEHAGALINLASLRIQQQAHDVAVDLLQRAVQLDPDCFICHYNLGNLYWRVQDLEAAYRSFERALTLLPSDVDARYNLAMTCLALEKYDEALPLLEQLSVERPDTVIIWRELGRLYGLQSRPDESEAAYAKAAELTDSTQGESSDF